MYNAVVVVDGVALGGFFGCLGENRGYRGYVGDWQCFRGRGGVLVCSPPSFFPKQAENKTVIPKITAKMPMYLFIFTEFPSYAVLFFGHCDCGLHGYLIIRETPQYFKFVH